MYSLDAIDARILLARDDSQDASLIELSKSLGLSRNTVHARLKRLRHSGALGSPSATLSPSSLERPLIAFVTLSVSQQLIDSVYDTIGRIPEIVEAHISLSSSSRKT